MTTGAAGDLQQITGLAKQVQNKIKIKKYSPYLIILRIVS